MDLQNRAKVLEQRFRELAAIPDDELSERYESGLVKYRPMPRSIYWGLRWMVGRTLYWFREQVYKERNPWPASLKDQPASANAKPVLIWAMGTSRASIREACDNLSIHLISLPRFAPVLITDVADFRYFSRLGWLVEYLPCIEGHGEPYDERKLKYLARQFQGAPILPVEAGLSVHGYDLDLRRWLKPGG